MPTISPRRLHDRSSKSMTLTEEARQALIDYKKGHLRYEQLPELCAHLEHVPAGLPPQLLRCLVEPELPEFEI